MAALKLELCHTLYQCLKSIYYILTKRFFYSWRHLLTKCHCTPCWVLLCFLMFNNNNILSLQKTSITLLRVIPTMTFIRFVTDKSSGILSDISSGILSGISSGILSGISSGILPGISSGILSDMLSSVLSGISSCIYEPKTRFKNPCHMSRVIISTPKTWLHMDETRCRQPCPAHGTNWGSPPPQGTRHHHAGGLTTTTPKETP